MCAVHNLKAQPSVLGLIKQAVLPPHYTHLKLGSMQARDSYPADLFTNEEFVQCTISVFPPTT